MVEYTPAQSMVKYFGLQIMDNIGWEQSTPVNTTVRAIAFANENLGIAVTNEGIIRTNNGGNAPNGIGAN